MNLLAQPFPLQAPAPAGTAPTGIRPYAVTGARGPLPYGGARTVPGGEHRHPTDTRRYRAR